MNIRRKLAFGVALAIIAFSKIGTALAVPILIDGFDTTSPLTDNWTIAQEPDTNVSLVDYSDFDLQSLFGVGLGTNLSIPEAPNSSEGPSTTGVVFTANTSVGSPASLNLISKSIFALSQFQFQYDVYLLSGGGAFHNNNSTETTVWGVGRNTVTPVGRSNRSSVGDGVWGWLATENGINEEDAAINLDTVELADIGDNFDPGAASLFDAAFDGRRFENDSPLGSWVTVKVNYDGTDVSVSFNDVPFLTETATPASGSIMVGYSDPFGSISSSPDLQLAVIDNVILEDLAPSIPEPASILLAAPWLAAIGLFRRNRK